jgi:hypothetical protein
MGQARYDIRLLTVNSRNFSNRTEFVNGFVAPNISEYSVL